MKVKRKITLTSVIGNGMYPEAFCRKFLLLRKACKVGDSEVVNNYQLGLLRENKRYGYVDFTEE